MSDPDWRKILVAYIDHVGHEEGTDFLNGPVPGLTPIELACLYEASAETAGEDHGTWLIKEAQQYREAEPS